MGCRRALLLIAAEGKLDLNVIIGDAEIDVYAKYLRLVKAGQRHRLNNDDDD